MSDIIDRMARAAYEGRRARAELHGALPWESVSDDIKVSWRNAMRDGLAAAREPDEAMIEAGGEALSNCYSLEPGEGLDTHPPEPIWQAMIDEILK